MEVFFAKEQLPHVVGMVAIYARVGCPKYGPTWHRNLRACRPIRYGRRHRLVPLRRGCFVRLEQHSCERVSEVAQFNRCRSGEGYKKASDKTTGKKPSRRYRLLRAAAHRRNDRRRNTRPSYGQSSYGACRQHDGRRLRERKSDDRLLDVVKVVSCWLFPQKRAK